MLRKAYFNGQAAGHMLHGLLISETALDEIFEFEFWTLLV